MKRFTALLLILVMCIAAVPSLAGWEESGGRWWYSYDDGGYAAGSWLQDGAWYYFDDGGWMVTGWKNIGGTWYYFDPSGTMASGWRQIGDDWYYFDTSGAMATGSRTIDGKEYFFADSGVWQESAVQTGWQKNGNAWYYYDENGEPATGWKDIDGVWYCFDGDGAMTTGWKSDGGVWYYFDASGAMVTGWKQITGTWYFFDASGKMVTGWFEDAGNWYYADKNGEMRTGWLEDNEAWYYLDASGVMQTGWVDDGGAQYYFYPTGAMAVNTLIEGRYYVDNNGKWNGVSVVANGDIIDITDGNQITVYIADVYPAGTSVIYKVGTNDVLSCTWGSYDSAMKGWPLTIKPSKAGSSTVTITNTADSSSVVMTINISGMKWSIADASTMMNKMNSILSNINDALEYGNMYLKYNRTSYGNYMYKYYKQAGTELLDAIVFAKGRVDIPTASGDGSLQSLLADAYAVYDTVDSSTTYLQLVTKTMNFSTVFVKASNHFLKFCNAILDATN